MNVRRVGDSFCRRKCFVGRPWLALSSFSELGGPRHSSDVLGELYFIVPPDGATRSGPGVGSDRNRPLPLALSTS